METVYVAAGTFLLTAGSILVGVTLFVAKRPTFTQVNTMVKEKVDPIAKTLEEVRLDVKELLKRGVE